MNNKGKFSPQKEHNNSIILSSEEKNTDAMPEEYLKALFKNREIRKSVHDIDKT